MRYAEVRFQDPRSGATMKICRVQRASEKSGMRVASSLTVLQEVQAVYSSLRPKRRVCKSAVCGRWIWGGDERIGRGSEKARAPSQPDGKTGDCDCARLLRAPCLSLQTFHQMNWGYSISIMDIELQYAVNRPSAWAAAVCDLQPTYWKWRLECTRDELNPPLFLLQRALFVYCYA